MTNLPKDLKNYARAAFWRKSRAFIISFVLTVLALIFFGDVILPTKYPEAKAIMYTVILALPFIFTKFPFCAIDSTYCGIVEDIEVKMTKEARPAPYSYKGHYIFDKGIVYLKIRTPDGGLIRRKVYGGIANLQKYINKYHEYDEVFHLYGTNTVVVMCREKSTHIECPVCGELNDKENEFCEKCGHTLVRDLAFAWNEALAQQKNTSKEKFDRPVEIRDSYVEEKKRVYDDYIEKCSKLQLEEVKESADTAKETPYSPSEARYDSYAEARRNAILARKMREEQEEKLKKEEAAFSADYDAEVIRKAKEEYEKKDKHKFFDEYFSYFGVAMLITHAVTFIAMPLLGNTFLRAEVNFFSQTLLFSIILFWQFFVFGKNEFPHKRVGKKKILLSGVPAFLVYAVAYSVYHSMGIFAS